MRSALVLVCLLLGCGVSPRAERMRPELVPHSADLGDHRVAVGTVTGGHASTFFTLPHLDAPTFTQALTDALRSADVWDPSGRYRLDATILLEDYAGGSTRSPDIRTGLTIRYALTDRRDGSSLCVDTVRSGSWVRFSEAFVGLERARISIERTTQQNLHELLARLTPLLEGLVLVERTEAGASQR